MAVALDASTPARVGGTTSAVATAPFTAPVDAFLVAVVAFDGNNTDITAAVTDSVDGATGWSQRVTRQITETTSGAYSSIWTKRITSAVSRTVSSTWSAGGAGPGLQQFLKVYVWTGVDVDGTPFDTVGANNEGGSTSNAFDTTSLTPGATGVLVAVSSEWNALGAFQASSNLTQDTDTAANLSYCSGYRTCSNGVGVSANFNAAGTSAAQHKWTQIIIREAGGAPPAVVVANRITLLGVQ